MRTPYDKMRLPHPPASSGEGWETNRPWTGVAYSYLDFAGLLALVAVAGLAAASRTSLIFRRLAMRALRSRCSRDRSPLRYDI